MRIQKQILYIFFFIFILNGYDIFSQGQSKLDSLLKLLPYDKNDTNKVRHLLYIADEYAVTDPIKSLDYSQKALNLAFQVNWGRGIAVSYFRVGQSYYAQGNFLKALEYKKKELKKWEELKFDQWICGALAEIGVIYSDLGKNVEAMEYYVASLKLAEKNDYKIRIVTNQCNMASLYCTQGDTVKAMEYYQKSLDNSRKFGLLNYEAENLTNIGNIYNNRKNLTVATEYYFKAQDIFKNLNNKINTAIILGNIGGMYQYRGDSARTAGNNFLVKKYSDKSLDLFFQALALSEELGNIFLQANFTGNIAAVYIIEKKFSEAEHYLKRSLELANQTKAIQEISIAYQRYADLYKKQGKFEKALLYYEYFVSSKDSITNEASKNQIAEMQIKYETEKKENENKILTRQNELQSLQLKNNQYFIAGLIIILIFVIAFAFLFIRQNKIKARQKALQFEQKLLRTQMNPHFIFNSLASIESFIYEQQPKEAGMYLSKFAQLMRLILENSKSEYITLAQELDTLNFYLSLQKMRLNEQLDYTIEIEPALNPDHIYIPPMLTQPFIENAIEHGFRGIKETGCIHIRFRLVNESIEVQITDNGIGMTQSQQQKDLHSVHKSMALQITRERLNILNKSKKQKMYFNVTDIMNEQNI